MFDAGIGIDIVWDTRAGNVLTTAQGEQTDVAALHKQDTTVSEYEWEIGTWEVDKVDKVDELRGSGSCIGLPAKSWDECLSIYLIAFDLWYAYAVRYAGKIRPWTIRFDSIRFDFDAWRGVAWCGIC
ncbi:hypothetical protein CLCR_07759 [Cladophialophora carrionii]|uniref:Uncharacterized protein n=1 Tax=Cladophialophora carrionii TaxID=86049 RepID=A0A1C1CPT3_9EURO|nr:hypothetical protein CLCR_07759 [Cladophialophora carrionii]